MTVRVRSLLRRPSGFVPPPPPPPAAYMTFISQPTNTIVGHFFDPPVAIAISDGQDDSVTISGYVGSCTVNPITITTVAGTGVFIALRADGTGQGCRLRVHNNTRPQIEDIISDAFNIVSPGIPIPDILATNIADSTNSISVTVTLDSTGADLLVALLVRSSANYPGAPPITGGWIADSENNAWQNATAWADDNVNTANRIMYAMPVNTNSAHEVSWVAGTVTYPAIAVMALRSNGSGFDLVGFGTNITGVTNTITLAQPIIVASMNAVIVSGYTSSGLSNPDVFNSSLPNQLKLGSTGNAWGIGFAWRENAQAVEQPAWFRGGTGTQSMTAAVFAPRP